MNIVLIKTFISVILVLLILLIRKLHNKNIKLPNYLLFYFLFRIIPIIIIYYVLGYEVQSDLTAYYHQANCAKQGLWIYKNFSSSHSFFFPYLLSIPLFIYNSGKMILIFISLLEFLAVFLFEKIVKLPNYNYLAIIYWLMPSQFIFTVFGGQDDFLLFLFFVPVLFFLKKSGKKIGFFTAIGFFATKIIFSLPVIPIFLLMKNKIRFIVEFCIVFIPLLLLLYFKVGFSFLTPLNESSSVSSPNIWLFMLPFFNGIYFNYLNIIGFVSIAFVPFISYFMVKKNLLVLNSYNICYLYIIVFSLFMIVSTKAYGYYFAIFSIPLVFLTFDKKPGILLFISFLMGLHPGFWHRINRPYYFSFKILFSKHLYILEYAWSLLIIILLILVTFNTLKLINKSE
jgi:hypothetical protein